MKTKETISVLIAIFVMFLLMYKSTPEEQEEEIAVPADELFIEDLIKAEHSNIFVDGEYMIDIFRITLDEGVFVELDENYLGLKAEEQYPSFESNGILFAINAGDTIKLGKDVFAKK